MKIDTSKSPETKKNCSTCKWHDGFTWACLNGESPFCADFTSAALCDFFCNPELTCKVWEQDNEYVKLKDLFELIDVLSANLANVDKNKYFTTDQVRYMMQKLKVEVIDMLKEENDAC